MSVEPTPRPSGAFPHLDVQERFAGRMAIAALWLLFFGALAQHAYADDDPAAAPLGLFAGLAVARLAWLAWRRCACGPVLTIAADGLTTREWGRIDWQDIAGFTVREERIKFTGHAFLDLCIRRPRRYDLPVSRAMPGRDGFAVRWIRIKWIDVGLAELDRVLCAARARDPAPFAASWGLDMDASEIHAALDEDDMLRIVHAAAGAAGSGDVEVPPEVHAALARAPDVLRAQTDAIARRSQRRRARATVAALVLLAMILLSAIARLID